MKFCRTCGYLEEPWAKVQEVGKRHHVKLETGQGTSYCRCFIRDVPPLEEVKQALKDSGNKLYWKDASEDERAVLDYLVKKKLVNRLYEKKQRFVYYKW